MPKTAGRSTSLIPIFGLLLALFFSGGYYIGKYGIPPRQPTGETAGRPVDLGNFWKTKEIIESRYVGKVDSDALITGATKGLVEGLGDPYSAFLTEKEADQLESTLAGKVEGIGIEVGAENGQITVIAPLPDSPAARAGLLAGDVILAVDGESLAGKSLEEVVGKIRGPKGSQVRLDVRTGQAGVRPVTITRDEVRSPSVTLSYRGDVAVIDLSRYGENVKEEMDVIVRDIQAKRPRGVILDLRSNPGGFLEGAVDVTSVFQKEGLVVREQFAEGKTEEKGVKTDGRLADLPLVILVNKGTASAAEITAGALRDNRGIKLVGEKTFGKGSVQELEPLDGGSVLKLTVAEWLTPKGTSISKQGLAPDTEAPGDAEAQLQAAIAQLGR